MNRFYELPKTIKWLIAFAIPILEVSAITFCFGLLDTFEISMAF